MIYGDFSERLKTLNTEVHSVRIFDERSYTIELPYSDSIIVKTLNGEFFTDSNGYTQIISVSRESVIQQGGMNELAKNLNKFDGCLLRVCSKERTADGTPIPKLVLNPRWVCLGNGPEFAFLRIEVYNSIVYQNWSRIVKTIQFHQSSSSTPVPKVLKLIPYYGITENNSLLIYDIIKTHLETPPHWRILGDKICKIPGQYYKFFVPYLPRETIKNQVQAPIDLVMCEKLAKNIEFTYRKVVSDFPELQKVDWIVWVIDTFKSKTVMIF